MTHSSGAAATSVETCAVTAISSPDGTAETKIQRPIVTQVGLGAVLLCPGSAELRRGALSIKTAQPATSKMSSTKPRLQIRFCICSVKAGSNSEGYASNARKRLTFEAEKGKYGSCG